MKSKEEILNKKLARGEDTYLAGQRDNIYDAMEEYAAQFKECTCHGDHYGMATNPKCTIHGQAQSSQVTDATNKLIDQMDEVVYGSNCSLTEYRVFKELLIQLIKELESSTPQVTDADIDEEAQYRYPEPNDMATDARRMMENDMARWKTIWQERTNMDL